MRVFKKTLALALVLSFIFTTAAIAEACTAFYLGKDTTDDNTYIFGRTEDVSASFAKLFTVRPAETHAAGDMYISSTGFKMEYPEQTLRYSMFKDSYNNEKISPEPYAEVGINEKNVAISATVTVSGAKTAITGAGGADPMVSGRNGGLAEVDLATAVLMQATSARHGCEVLGALIEKYGAGSRDGVFISDPEEVWYFQSLSGHQYAAVKCPDNKIGLSPNVSGRVDISDTANVIASPNLVKVAQDAGTYVEDADGKFDVIASYHNAPALSSYTGRLRLGTYYLLGLDAALALPTTNPTPYWSFFSDPRADQKYSLYEAMRLLAFRGEGTDWYAGTATGNGTSIGNDNTVEGHVFNLRPELPPQIATVQWTCMGPAEFSVYLPTYGSLLTDTLENFYTPDVKGYNDANPDNNTVYNVFRELYTLCKGPRGAAGIGTLESRVRYGDGVKAFWERYQKSLIEQQKLVDEDMVKVLSERPDLAELKATELSKAISLDSFNYAKAMLAELKAFQTAGTSGSFTPSALADAGAIPHYATVAKDAKFVSVTLDKDTQYSGQSASVDVSVKTSGVVDVTAFEAVLYGPNNKAAAPAVSGYIIDNKANFTLNIPAGLAAGSYFVQVSLGRGELPYAHPYYVSADPGKKNPDTSKVTGDVIDSKIPPVIVMGSKEKDISFSGADLLDLAASGRTVYLLNGIMKIELTPDLISSLGLTKNSKVNITFSLQSEGVPAKISKPLEQMDKANKQLAKQIYAFGIQVDKKTVTTLSQPLKITVDISGLGFSADQKNCLKAITIDKKTTSYKTYDGTLSGDKNSFTFSVGSCDDYGIIVYK